MTRSVSLSSSSWQGLSAYPLHHDKVCQLILFIMTRSIILSSSSWQGLSFYPLHHDKVCHFILFIMTRSVILSPSSWQGLSFYPLHHNKVGYLTPFALTSSVIMSSNKRHLLCCTWKAVNVAMPSTSCSHTICHFNPSLWPLLSSCSVTISRSYLEGSQHCDNVHLMFPHHLPEVLRGVW